MGMIEDQGARYGWKRAFCISAFGTIELSAIHDLIMHCIDEEYDEGMPSNEEYSSLRRSLASDLNLQVSATC